MDNVFFALVVPHLLGNAVRFTAGKRHRPMQAVGFTIGNRQFVNNMCVLSREHGVFHDRKYQHIYPDTRPPCVLRYSANFGTTSVDFEAPLEYMLERYSEILPGLFC